MKQLTVFFLALGLTTACAPKKDTSPPDGGGPACTQEAKVCPDGSAVGRTGPNCEFAACPEGEAPTPDAEPTPDAAPEAAEAE